MSVIVVIPALIPIELNVCRENAAGFVAGRGPIGLPLPNVEIKILDDQGKEVALGEAGEIAIKGPQVMQGYWQRPDETALVMTADGFFKSGDVGWMRRATSRSWIARRT